MKKLKVVFFFSHDTPSRIPLIYHPPPPPPPPSPPGVPMTLVIVLFVTYVCLGAATFTAFGWDFPEAVYFCFVALSTIGIEQDAMTSRGQEPELFACCVYLFLGLVVVAMCFSLVQEEVNSRCRQYAAR